jgi:hypothetical protein
VSDPRRLIPAYRLSQLLRITSETLRVWHVTGYLKAQNPRPKDPHYTLTELDLFLVASARGYKEPPGIEQLLSGELTLLTIKEVLGMLDMPKTTLLHRLHTGAIKSFKFRGSVRIDKASAEAYAANTVRTKTQPAPGFTRKEISHICGCSTDFLSAMIGNGTLKLDAASHKITSSSFMGWLDQLLPDWIDPQDWIDDRLTSGTRLMYSNEVLTYLGLARDELKPLMDRQQLQYIMTPGGHYYLSPVSVRGYFEKLAPLTMRQIAHLFGPVVTSVYKWVDEGKLVCTVHEPHDGWYKPCVLGALSQHLSPGLIPSNWYEIRQRSRERLVSHKALAARYNWQPVMVARFAAMGIFKGVRSPGSQDAWYFTRYQAKKIGQARRAGRL